MELVEFLEGNERGEEESRIPHKFNFYFPPNWRDLEGDGRGDKLYHYNFNYNDIFILKYQNYRYLHFLYC
jgi:hypothetical protein